MCVSFCFSRKDTVFGHTGVVYISTQISESKHLSKCAPTMSRLFMYRSNLWWDRQERSLISEMSIIGGETLFQEVCILQCFSYSL